MIQVSAASSDDRFPYGASYSPLVFPESQWVQDLRRMQAARINLVRIGDVHGSWDRIEPRRGEMRLDVLGRFYRLAAEYDVRVLLSNGTACPPLWLETLYPDVRIVSSRGERYQHAASYHWACIHHPGYVEEARRYTAVLADFAAAQPNHFGWQISNEMGFPFMPAFSSRTSRRSRTCRSSCATASTGTRSLARSTRTPVAASTRPIRARSSTA